MLKRLFLAFTLLFTVTALTAFFNRNWIEDKIQSWVERRLIKNEIAELNKKLPFEIIDVEIKGKIRHFLMGDTLPIHVKLKKDSHIVTADGNARLGLPERNLKRVDLSFQGDVVVDQFHPKVELEVTLEDELKSVSKLLLKTSPLDIQEELNGVKIEAKQASSEFSKNGNDFDLHLGFHSLHLEQSAEHVIEVSKPEIHLSTNLKSAELTALAFSSETLWGKYYFDLPLKPFTIQARFESNSLISGDLPKNAKIDILRGKKSLLNINIKSVKPLVLNWNQKELSLPWLWQLLKPIPATEVSQGSFDSQGTIRGDLTQLEKSEIQSRLSISKLRIKAPTKGLAFRDLDSELLVQIRNQEISISRGSLSVVKLFLNGLKGELKPYYFTMLPIAEKKSDQLSKIAQYKSESHSSLKTTYRFSSLPEHQNLPLKFDLLPVHFGELSGEIDTDKNAEEGFDFYLPLKLEKTSLSSFYEILCHPSKNPLPLTVEADLKTIRISKGVVDPQGSIVAKLWGGEFKIEDLGFFDLLSPVPETDFDVAWTGIRLDQAGQWLGFGEMDGTLEGHARNVVMQSFLPTQFDFHSEVKPHHRKKIVFSPDAMKNVVRLFASDGVDQIPGIAKWFAFGWPSRVFGGYDVQYAGIQADSQDGWIELQTLDPEKIVEIERKHFILYGPRFKMPLNSERYPLVVDATAMDNFIRRVVLELKEMAIKKRQQEQIKNGKSISETSEEDSELEEILSCFKPDF